jgi:hypothetical protein
VVLGLTGGKRDLTKSDAFVAIEAVQMRTELRSQEESSDGELDPYVFIMTEYAFDVGWGYTRNAPAFDYILNILPFHLGIRTAEGTTVTLYPSFELAILW